MVGSHPNSIIMHLLNYLNLVAYIHYFYKYNIVWIVNKYSNANPNIKLNVLER
jgi:hypothetical protein